MSTVGKKTKTKKKLLSKMSVQKRIGLMKKSNDKENHQQNLQSEHKTTLGEIIFTEIIYTNNL